MSCNSVKPEANDDEGLNYQFCKNCRKVYNITKNNDRACKYHSGRLKVDYDADIWLDWDDSQGPEDTVYNQEEYPTGFMWTCCERSGDEEPCEKGRHVAKE